MLQLRSLLPLFALLAYQLLLAGRSTASPLGDMDGFQSAPRLPGNLQKTYETGKRSRISRYALESKIYSPLSEDTVPAMTHQLKCKGKHRLPVVVPPDGKYVDANGKVTVIRRNGRRWKIVYTGGRKILAFANRKGRKTVDDQNGKRAIDVRMNDVSLVGQNNGIQCSWHDNCWCVNVVCPEGHFTCFCEIECK